ncbi:MAG: efflux RND transporter periplasmic adaptor subunit [Candidatus Cloacimonetes bacterium]|nr:efflux RND transporter periplasmic adaptor subunit [Candidatus Cloacimonadota bacterium]
MKKIMIIALMVISLLLVNSCGRADNNGSRSIEQIQQDEGIPVRVKVMEAEPFIKNLPFTAVLSGYRQSNASAMIGGRIEHIYVQVGDYVEKDQVLMSFPEDAPAGQFQQARSAYELALSTWQRLQNLFEAGGISRQELDAARTQLTVAEANWDAVQQMLKVRAPISGYVTNLPVRETDGVQSEAVLATISETRKLKARVWVTEDEICQIKQGNPARAAWQEVSLEGYVSQVAMAMDSDHRAFAVDLILENPDNLCKSGVMGEIAIQTYSNPQAFLVERKVIQTDQDGTFVYLVNSETARKVYVETGEENSSIEVISGLQQGDRVIVEGLNLIGDGIKVRVIE